MILHIFTINGPADVSPWPPSVIASGWPSRLGEGAVANGCYDKMNANGNVTCFIWNNEAELTNYVNTYKLTDAALISDLNAWKAAHGITFTTQYFDLSGSSITVPDVVS